MHQIGDMGSLWTEFGKHGEVIVYVQGNEGNRFLDFLGYVNRINKVVCVTDSRDDDTQEFIDTRPVIPLRYLKHFRERALFVVAAPISRHAKIEETLKDFGCDYVVFLNNLFYTRMTREVGNFSASLRLSTWAAKALLKKADALEQSIAYQREISDLNTKAFAKYRNRFRNREVVVVAAGNTLKYYTPIKGAIHIGVDFAWRNKGIPLDFLLLWDFAADRKSMTDCFERVKERVFLGKCRENNTSEGVAHVADVDDFGDKVCWYRSSGGEGAEPCFMSPDLCNHALADFGSSTFSALYFALYTYPKKIYLAGFDSAFTDNSKMSEEGLKHSQRIGYARLKMFAQKYYSQTEIVSINPIDLAKVFTDIQTEEYTDSLTVKKTYKRTSVYKFFSRYMSR